MEVVKEKPSLQKYPAYKNSGVEWLEEIPEHWTLRRFKYLFKELNERSSDGTEDLLSVSQYTGVTRKGDKVEEGDLLTNASTLEGYKKVQIGDLVTNIMLAWNGSLGFSPFEGITSPAYSIYRLQRNNEERYFHYLLRTDRYKAEFKRNSSGVIESRLRLYSDDFFRILSLLPPKEEQTAIASFLDEKCGKIDTAIAQKEKLIQLLKERKQVIIQNAVTKGLDPDVKMKDSGVEWIGEIPEHWEVSKFKNYIKLRHGHQFLDHDFTQEGIEVVKITQLHKDGYLDLSKATKVSPNHLKKYEDILIKEGDVLMCLTGGTIGKIIRVGRIDRPLLQNYRVGHFSAVDSEQIDNNYIFHLMSSEMLLEQIFLDLGETGQPNIGMEDMKNMIICVPPRDEQSGIVRFIENHSLKTEEALALQWHQIEKLKEYKSSLIDAAVTGKIKVN